MSQIPEMMNGNALNHDIPVEPGFGLKVKGQTPLLTALSGATSLLSFRGEAITIAAATHTLLVTGTAAANQTVITSNFLIVDPTGNRNLDLPAEALCTGLLLLIMNNATGSSSETITLRNDAAATIATIEEAEQCLVYCDGTTWRGLVGGAT
tara:strand:+ start:1274 stop:1729 length:456 start_codon:yes stop_codon:yes gene_type:complete